jgi:HK97 family phage major capsid protein
METEVMKQEVIDELKKSGGFVTRSEVAEEIHNGMMDVLKDITPVRPQEFDATSPSQKKMVEQDICKWYSTVLGERKAWEDVTTHVGHELVPELVAGRIVEKLDNTPFRKLVTHFPGDKGVIAVENTLPTALRMGATRAATAEVTPTHAEVSYSTYGGTAWLLLGNKLIRNATPAIVQYTENALVRSISRLETYEFTLGSGTRSFTGLKTGATAHYTATPIDTVAEITLASAYHDFFALDEPYRSNATWLFPQEVVAQLWSVNKLDTPLIDVVNKTCMGRPYVELPSTCWDTVADDVPYSYFGDMSYFYLFEEKPVSLRVANEGYTLSIGDQTLIAAQFETDGKVVLASAINANEYHTA